MKRPVAFFDIDGTLFRWSLFLVYVDLMIERGLLPEIIKERAKPKYERWLNREGSYQDYLDVLVKGFNDYIAGVRVEDFYRAVKDSLTGRDKRVYRFTRDFIRELKDEGYFLVAITHSSKIAADLFAENYGFDKVYGLMFEIDEDVFTGQILNRELIFDKGKIVERVFQDENLNIDPERSVAVGDTHSDIAMLEKVTRPIAFNPNKILYLEAKKRGWEVVVERKDVIYKNI